MNKQKFELLDIQPNTMQKKKRLEYFPTTWCKWKNKKYTIIIQPRGAGQKKWEEEHKKEVKS